MSHLNVTASNGNRFEFALSSPKRGRWGFRVTEANGVQVDGDTGSDPVWPTERDARRGARQFAEVAHEHPKHGWCS